MHQSQLAISEIKRFYKRRKKILILCPLLVLGLGIGAAYWLPPQYKSSISILVQKEGTLNPMVRYNMAVALASEDRLKSFNEIIYSRSTMNMLIDSLGLANEDINLNKRAELIDEIRGNVITRLKASDSFSIIYYDQNPERAKEGVKLLADYFIQTKLQLENERNIQTVTFFQSKLGELRQAVDSREKKLRAKIQQNFENTPREDRALHADLERVEGKLDEINVTIENIRNRLQLAKAINSGKRELEALYQLDLSSIPLGGQLQNLLSTYQEYSKKYTSEFIEVQRLKRRIFDMTGILVGELESSLFDKQSQKSFLESQYNELAKKIEQTTLAERKTMQTKLDHDVYRELYDEMKVKLEQAKTTRDMGEAAKNQFVVIDPPIVPQEPSRPNKILLMGGGFGLGLFLGLIAAALAELMDTTVTRPEDLKKLNKPVIAFIPRNNV